LSNEGRTDLAPAKTVQHEGILSLTCPSCGAPLPATEGSRIVECSFCHLVSRLPGDTAKGKARSMPAPQLWWLAFSGPSLLRKELEKGPDRDGRSLEEAPLRKDTDPLGQGMKWAPILLFPSIALLITGVICIGLWKAGMLG
jgi:LSD1 subclass zinc finger protein